MPAALAALAGLTVSSDAFVLVLRQVARRSEHGRFIVEAADAVDAWSLLAGYLGLSRVDDGASWAENVNRVKAWCDARLDRDAPPGHVEWAPAATEAFTPSLDTLPVVEDPTPPVVEMVEDQASTPRPTGRAPVRTTAPRRWARTPRPRNP